jgi:CheY-like chemotaxis protein/HPt (histidine-containing phosphotransfer) domain-containing protein
VAEVLAELVKTWGATIWPDGVSEGDRNSVPAADVAILDVDTLLARNIFDDTSVHEQIVDASNVISLSGIASKEALRQLRNIHFTASLSWPIRRSSLFESLGSILAGGESPDLSGDAGSVQPLDVTQGRKILLVEDNAVNQQVTSALLQKYGCEVEVANNGKEALEHIKAGHYDLVFMDCQMPVMDGFEATRQIRKHEQDHALATTPIIALTANALDADREACLASGMDDFLVKPVRATTIVAVFERYLAFKPLLKASHTIGDTEVNKDHFNFYLLGELQELLSKEQFEKLVAEYVASARNRIAQMIQATDQQDLEMLENASHSLKGSSANLGAQKLSAMCDKIVQSARGGIIPDEFPLLIDEIKNEFELVRQYLTENRVVVSSMQ